jgi:glycine betaine catabolism A
VSVHTELPPSLIPTLPGRAYTDPTVFQQEQARIFEAYWFAAARTSDLEAPGSFQTVDVGRENVVIVRGRDKKLRAFLNVCRHRGARVCMEKSGTGQRKLQCGYHAWTYGLDGALVAAPNLTQMDDVDRTEYGLVPVHLREWLGYVWVCLADEPPSFEETVTGAVAGRLGDDDIIEGWKIDQLEVGRRVTYDVKANWKLIIENFMECYHCATIHPELTDVLPEFADGYAAQYFVGHGAEFGENVSGFTVDGTEGLDVIPSVAPEHDRRYYAITVNPQVFINLVPDHVIFHRMYPVAADRTIVDCDWLYLPEVVASGRDLSHSIELFHRVNEQDFDAAVRCQLASNSRAYASGGVLVPSEHHIGRFHEWVSQHLDASVGPA